MEDMACARPGLGAHANTTSPSAESNAVAAAATDDAAIAPSLFRSAGEIATPTAASPAAQVEDVPATPHPLHSPPRPPPWWSWGVLAIAVAAMSSGGVWFSLMLGTPPMLRAAWRLSLTALLQLPPFWLTWRRADAPLRSAWTRSLPTLAAVGMVLALHFCAWSVSVTTTSLTHSLLFVSTTPILLVLWTTGRALLSRAARAMAPRLQVVAAEERSTEENPAPVAPGRSCCTQSATVCLGYDGASLTLFPTVLETAGTLIGFSAVVVLALDAGGSFGPSSSPASASTGDSAPSLAGDAVATLGAAAMGIYVLAGSRMQRTLPLFLYIVPVNVVAASAAGLASVALEPAFSWSGAGPASLLGWLGSGTRFGVALGAALCSGIAGHTLANLALQHIHPLVVSVVLLGEPILGSLFGWAVGVQAVPGAVTCGAGVLLTLGAGMVTLGVAEGGVVLSPAWRARLAACLLLRRQQRYSEIVAPGPAAAAGRESL